MSAGVEMWPELLRMHPVPQIKICWAGVTRGRKGLLIVDTQVLGHMTGMKAMAIAYKLMRQIERK